MSAVATSVAKAAAFMKQHPDGAPLADIRKHTSLDTDTLIEECGYTIELTAEDGELCREFSTQQRAQKLIKEYGSKGIHVNELLELLKVDKFDFGPDMVNAGFLLYGRGGEMQTCYIGKPSDLTFNDKPVKLINLCEGDVDIYDENNELLLTVFRYADKPLKAEENPKRVKASLKVAGKKVALRRSTYKSFTIPPPQENTLFIVPSMTRHQISMMAPERTDFISHDDDGFQTSFPEAHEDE